MQAFVVRPFNTKNGIDFEKVHSELITVALNSAGINGGTTGTIFEAGNIREDMFQLLLLADLVVADISIHNANVFYELGIRHALRPRQTFMIRAAVTKPRDQRGPEDQIPFDIATDRYLEYDAANPGASVARLVHGLNATKTGDRIDSPVFRSLPKLEEPDHSQLSPVPPEFADDVDLASSKRQAGKLGLLAREAGWFLWQEGGLRAVGQRQFALQLWSPARDTWEKLRETYPDDFEANRLLGTIYQKTGDLTLSDQRLQQALRRRALEPAKKAEVLALLASNQKARGRRAWEGKDSAARRKATLRSRLFEQAAQLYQEGFEQDLNHYYSGLNALSLYTLLLQTMEADESTWLGIFDSDDEAERRRVELKTSRDRLAAAVGLSLKAESSRLEDGAKDPWLAISQADYRFLTSPRDTSAAASYEAALANAEPFHISAVRSQVELFGALDVWPPRVKACLEVLPPVPEGEQPLEQTILFTGHMIDAEGRKQPRFPASQEGKAREAIRNAVSDLLTGAPGPALGMAGGANGGDILFHEVCAELGVPTRVLLTLPESQFIAESVAHGGPGWVGRFNALIRKCPTQILGDSKDLPRWMRDKPGYDVWQRTNLWLLEEALATGARTSTLIALWDGKSGDGPGGTKHLVETAEKHGMTRQILPTSTVFQE